MSTQRKAKAETLDLSHLPIAGYGRISRIGSKDGNRISMPEQRRSWDEQLASKGRELYSETFEDTNRSGGTTAREEFQRLLDLLRQRKIGGIVVKTLDRFSRDVIDFLTILGEVEELGGVLLCGDGDVTLRGGTSAYLATMRIAHSALEREQRAEYLETSVRAALDRGVHLSAPYGYEKGDGRGKPLTLDAERAPTVRHIFLRRIAGVSWTGIARELNEGDYPQPRPYARRDHETMEVTYYAVGWSHKLVKRIAENRAYTGVAFNGDREVEGAHPAIVSAAEYASANRRKGTRYGQPTDGYLLTGLLRCANCGRALAHTKDGHGRRHYRCRAAMAGAANCPKGASVSAEAIEAYVYDAFAERWLAGAIVAVPTNEHLAGLQEAVTVASDGLARALRNLATLDLDSETEAGIAREVVAEKRAALAGAEADLAEAVRAEAGADLPITLDQAMYDGAPIADKRHWLGIAFPLIVVKPGGHKVALEDRVRLLDAAPTGTDRVAMMAAARAVAW